jgi:hypothetical protein
VDEITKSVNSVITSYTLYVYEVIKMPHQHRKESTEKWSQQKSLNVSIFYIMSYQGNKENTFLVRKGQTLLSRFKEK